MMAVLIKERAKILERNLKKYKFEIQEIHNTNTKEIIIICRFMGAFVDLTKTKSRPEINRVIESAFWRADNK